jgi:hypothetical protein
MNETSKKYQIMAIRVNLVCYLAYFNLSVIMVYVDLILEDNSLMNRRPDFN